MKKLNKKEQKDVQEMLWNIEDETGNSLSNEQYSSLLIEQYRIYAETTDSAGFRRIMINLFFLVVSLFVVGFVALGMSKSSTNLPAVNFLTIAYIAGLAFCYSWWKIVRFFRHHYQIKSTILSSLEKRMPSKVWLTEEHIGETKGSFKPIKALEMYMPFIFMGIYTAVYLYIFIFWPIHK